jgi:putative methionine-R-sulfoxide reductase with GAF domain
MPGAPQSEHPLPPDRRDLTALGEGELGAALQLLVERAQYITGATGTALALPQGDEMVCRASAGACAPAVGARLQVRSGLTGESIARRQLLRCDNAETDPRVNLETCHALGIASIVVLPLLRRSGEVRGLFELFSDHPYAFEERDLVALERMAALTLTALDLAEQSQDSATSIAQTPRQAKPALPEAAVVPAPKKEAPKPQPLASEAAPEKEIIPPPAAPTPVKLPETAVAVPQQSVAPPETPTSKSEARPVSTKAAQPETTPPIMVASSMPVQVAEPPPPEPPNVPEAMRRVQKCSSCGFPVSEGRTLCLDCETLERLKLESEKKAREKGAVEGRQATATATSAGDPVATTEEGVNDVDALKERQDDQISPALTPDEILPPFLTNPQLTEEPWLARHVNLLAFLVLVAAVLVAAVVFFR